jgi:hypothetical protein
MRPSSILALALLLSLLASPAFGAPADPRRIVQASEILAKIERGGPVEYYGVIVVGDLDLSGLDLPTKHVERSEDEIRHWDLTEEVKVVKSLIWIENSEIRGVVNFSNSNGEFKKQISFLGINFTKGSLGSSLFHVGRLNLSFPNLRYIVVTKFFVVLKPLAAYFAD